MKTGRPEFKGKDDESDECLSLRSKNERTVICTVPEHSEGGKGVHVQVHEYLGEEDQDYQYESYSDPSLMQ